jgi:ketosteroid isomerase-like protein
MYKASFGKEMAIMTNKEIVEGYIREYNRRDVKAMLKYFSDGIIFESVSNTTGIIRTINKEELRALASISVEYFSERRQSVRRWVIGGDHVAIEIDYWCRLAKDLPNGKKAGEEMAVRGVSFFTIMEGFITELTDFT